MLEADEYRGAFGEYAHRFAQLVITNIDFDHPDYYPSQEAVEKAFGELLAHTPARRTGLRLRRLSRSAGGGPDA